MANSDWDISVCGLNCARCDEHLGTKCGGCRGPAEQCWSGNCTFRTCARSKGHDYCFQCDGFPCEGITAFANDGYEHHALTVANMRRMREVGLERWIAEQPKVVFCPGWGA
jgi:hypothetical protein